MKMTKKKKREQQSNKLWCYGRKLLQGNTERIGKLRLMGEGRFSVELVYLGLSSSSSLVAPGRSVHGKDIVK